MPKGKLENSGLLQYWDTQDFNAFCLFWEQYFSEKNNPQISIVEKFHSLEKILENFYFFLSNFYTVDIIVSNEILGIIKELYIILKGESFFLVNQIKKEIPFASVNDIKNDKEQVADFVELIQIKIKLFEINLYGAKEKVNFGNTIHPGTGIKDQKAVQMIVNRANGLFAFHPHKSV